MKCMMLKGGNSVFHLSASSHYFDAVLQNSTSLWSIFESFVVMGHSVEAFMQIFQLSLHQFSGVLLPP